MLPAMESAQAVCSRAELTVVARDKIEMAARATQGKKGVQPRNSVLLRDAQVVPTTGNMLPTPLTYAQPELQDTIEGEPSRSPYCCAVACTLGHSAAAAAGVMLDWEGMFGSLKPRRATAPGNIPVTGTDREPHTIAT